MSYLKMFSIVLFSVLALTSFSFAADFPSECERENALLALQEGEIDPAIRYFLKLRDYYIEVAGEPFNRDYFISKMEEKGEETPEYLIEGVRAVSDKIRSEFLEKAALASYDAGNLAYLRSSEEARKYYLRANEIFPAKKYQDVVDKVEKELANKKD